MGPGLPPAESPSHAKVTPSQPHAADSHTAVTHREEQTLHLTQHAPASVKVQDFPSVFVGLQYQSC